MRQVGSWDFICCEHIQSQPGSTGTHKEESTAQGQWPDSGNRVTPAEAQDDHIILTLQRQRTAATSLHVSANFCELQMHYCQESCTMPLKGHYRFIYIVPYRNSISSSNMASPLPSSRSVFLKNALHFTIFICSNHKNKQTKESENCVSIKLSVIAK